MIMYDKLQIYYQPANGNANGIKSLTVSFYEFDPPHNTYKQKIVLEIGDAKYKIKRYTGGYGALEPKLAAIDLIKYPQNRVSFAEDYFYIKFGDQVLTTNNKAEIQDLLDAFGFDTVLSYDISQYKKCD
jgi:hypothetical protein